MINRHSPNRKHRAINGPSNRQKNGILSDQWLELLDELNIGAFTVDMQRKITSMNYAAQGLMGLKELEVVGNDCREIFTGVPCLVNCFLRGDAGCTTEEPDVEIIEDEV